MSCLIVEHFLGGLPERFHDMAFECLSFAVDTYRNLVGKITVTADDGYFKWYADSSITIELHAAMTTDTLDDAMADMSVFPERVAKFTNLLMLDAFGAVTPKQTVFVGNAAILLIYHKLAV